MDKTISVNFSVAKVLAIFAVVASHWFHGMKLWILSTIALFLFGFASTYFTARLNGSDVDIGAFWKKKLRRLGIRYWFILAALAILLVVADRDIFHWHTLVHLTGMSGVLNLFGPSHSALGRGLWFFTLLLLFYAAYPLLARKLQASARTTTVLCLVAAGLAVLNETVSVGFALWPTMLGFFLGVYVGINPLRLSAGVLHRVLVAVPLLMALLNAVFGIRELNKILLVVFALALSLRLTLPGLRLGGMRRLAALEALLLEIYLIHSYLFVRPTGISVLDFTISLGLIIPVAMVLNIAGNRLVAWIFDRTAARAPRAAVEAEGEATSPGRAVETVPLGSTPASN